MESFDQSLKYLLHQEPAAFVRFGFRDPSIEVLKPLESGLPSRGRDIDGSYLILRGGERAVAHVEFHRRHQALEDLAIDVAEAQIRLFRRERLQVLSQVWDLYGRANEPVVEDHTLLYGAGSQSTYQRVNLRGLRWEELLAHGPPALWPLVALTQDGATEAVVHKVRDAIEARTALSVVQRTDHLAVLWFVAEAESVPVQAMKDYLSEERLMESELYKSIFEKGAARGEAQGEARGKAEVYAETIIQLLIRWIGALDPAIRERIATLPDREILKAWHQEALYLADAEGARRLAEKIQKAPLPACP